MDTGTLLGGLQEMVEALLGKVIMAGMVREPKEQVKSVGKTVCPKGNKGSWSTEMVKTS